MKADRASLRSRARPAGAVSEDHRERDRVRVARPLRPPRPRRESRRSPSTDPTSRPRHERISDPGGPRAVLLPARRVLDHRRGPADARDPRAPGRRRGRQLRVLRHRQHGDRRHRQGRTESTCHTARGETIARAPVADGAGDPRPLRRAEPLRPGLLQPWKVEHDSLDRQLYCYAISAKRYALYRTRPDGNPNCSRAQRSAEDALRRRSDDDEDSLTDWSEHGLGMYLDPTTKNREKPQRDEEGRGAMDPRSLGLDPRERAGNASPQPAWAQRYALTRFTVSSPALAGWFKGYDRSPAPRRANPPRQLRPHRPP